MPIPRAFDPLIRPLTWFWILAALSAILLLAPIRVGDLAGYDDARYALVAKDMVLTGHWWDVRSNGGPALEHPPLLSWLQAALFACFGFSDALAKAPSALCGLGTILLVPWLARRITGDRILALIAMFVTATTIYFVKYAAHAMTDVPFTFFFLCSVCAWVLAEDDPRWYVAAGVFAAFAQLTRAMMGVAIPVVFAIDWFVTPRRRPPLRYIIYGLAAAFLPPIAWYAQWIIRYGQGFFAAHSIFLHDEVYGPLSPAWRRYTGAIEYLAMIAKSYWPWLPAMIAGIVVVAKAKDRKSRLLLVWVAVVFLLCAVARSRVLRYMLPAYPAFSILSAIGIMHFVPRAYLRNALVLLTPLLGIVVLAIAIRPPVIWQAKEVRPIAEAETRATSPGELVTFYDAGQPRFDETNQMLWYGDRFLVILSRRDQFDKALAHPRSQVFVVDRDTYQTRIAPRFDNRVIATSGHLVCVRLALSSSMVRTAE